MYDNFFSFWRNICTGIHAEIAAVRELPALNTKQKENMGRGIN